MDNKPPRPAFDAYKQMQGPEPDNHTCKLSWKEVKMIVEYVKWLERDTERSTDK